MESLLLSRRDLEFMLFEWLQVQSLAERERYADHSRETLSAALDTYEAIARDFFAPHNKKNDQHEPQFDGERVTVIPEVKAALRAFSEAGLMAARQDYELGGMQLPFAVERAGVAYAMAANLATSGFAFLTIANAELLLTYGTPEQVDRYVRPMMQGRFFGTMCLSEPQAGSSLGDIRTRAEPRPDGTYRLFGNKMWISGGEHEVSENIVHLVLAKIPNPDGSLPPGVQGISLFLVPRRLVQPDGSLGERNDVVLAGLNHKMGYRGLPNCLLNFGEGRHTPQGEPGALGYLVGEAGKGLACMFKMMNEARIAVGLSAAVLGYTGYLHALDYARNRPQGRLPGQKDPTQPQVPIVRHPDVKRMLLTQKAYAEGGLALALYSARLIDEQHSAPDAQARIDAERLLDLLTPVTKSWPSQWCLEANSLAIQVHGGYGYTREYNVEQFYRDNRLNPIHEGTHGIQALDLLGRKLRLHDGASLALLDARVRDTIARARAGGDAALAAHAQALEDIWGHLGETTTRLLAVPDADARLANAGPCLEAFGHVVMAWIWLEQGIAAAQGLASADDERSQHFYRGKLQACRYFFHWELPRVPGWLAVLDPVDLTCAEMQDEWF
ncbi:acyl-CoA dehydrogenase [Caldimonas thermodepolymerans]|uniref:Acyl-CoA dehydrogenase n=1 Tax=Caldimonas thermodepolymerans TaxID=215580 RepID=A0A2S5T570_9BURK|nr:acyl-CoA dehydrogenase [Caldimonas thermodepolymerans]PPE70140.1 acyl-CoA dehydrogenase [Caldimonas thermodepolymerans]QPC32133.1 acyl-CoA dehydrogenase [Caldimonas thermodepolymerans]RDH98017.1 butyryl-CoA dehydrogenase/acyl-CoA dehydrogenase [Caldimonas thermodepolymerans]